MSCNKENAHEDAVEAIITETIERLPSQLEHFFKNPPGMRPAKYVQLIQGILSKLDDTEAEVLIRCVVDASVFAVFSLMDQGFKDRRIATSFRYVSRDDPLLYGHALEVYRSRVDPGGEKIVD